MDKPLIIRVPKELAAPFSEAYCKKYNVPYNGDPSFGHDVLWYAAIHKDAIRSVIGFLAVPEGVYVFGYYMDTSPHAIRAFLALNKWGYSLGYDLWGHVREDNSKMYNRLLKEGWKVESSNGTEFLMHWLNDRNVVKCQEVST